MDNLNNAQKLHDLIIIGGGPAGCTAGIYASRYRIKNVIIAENPGGLITDAHKVCNYPTEPQISGQELAKKLRNHLENEGGRIIQGTVKSIKKEEDYYKIKTVEEKEYQTKTVLLAVGTKRRRLELPQENKFLGRGVSYCATCDAMFFQGKDVAVVGGSDAANTASLLLSETSSKVYQIYRGEKLRGEPAWIEKVKENPKIEVIYNTNVKAILGEENLQGIRIDKSHQGKVDLKVEGLFIEIGSEPESILTKKLDLKTDNGGYIKVSPDQSTSQEGVFAAGDITTASDKFRQVITACAEGAVAANSIYKYLKAKTS